MKLYYGGFGNYNAFAVAENEQKAIEQIGRKINAPYLPVTVNEIGNVDEFSISPNKGDLIAVPKTGIGDLSDGYHTFNELYHHRAVLFSVICNMFPDRAWKSKKHDDGTMYDGMFIVGIETDQGQATYHYDIDPYWQMFKVKELDSAPKWDGHTPSDAISRISILELHDVKPDTSLRKCKKCDFTCENQGELLAHYREKHPKEA